ncbi:MAG: DUF5333 domain-containing protein [Pseudomonadota bacterium]
MIRAVLTLSLVLAPLSTPLVARSPGDIAEVRNGLLAVAVGDAIQENCGSINPRMIRVLSLRNRLLSAAKAQGFSNEEIEAFVDDAVARANLEAEAQRYLAQEGVLSGDEASYCALGAREIAAKTTVGRLLHAK